MWWDKFEIRLTNAFAIVDKDAGWQLNTDESKLHLLNKKFRADFLTNMKTAIQAQPNWTLPPRSNANESLHDCLARIDTIYEFSVNAERGMQANMVNFA